MIVRIPHLIIRLLLWLHTGRVVGVRLTAPKFIDQAIEEWVFIDCLICSTLLRSWLLGGTAPLELSIIVLVLILTVGEGGIFGAVVLLKVALTSQGGQM